MMIALLICLLSLHGSDDFETRENIERTPDVRKHDYNYPNFNLPWGHHGFSS